MSKNKKIVPIFFGFDDKFAKYASVAISSLIANCDPERKYRIHCLHTDVTEENQEKILSLATGHKNVTIEFNDVSNDIAFLVTKLPIRDYYTPSTYYRMLIAKLFPQYDKCVYLDSDMAIVSDVAKLYDMQLGNKLVGAVPEAVMALFEPGALYAEKVVGVNRKKYFNAGMLLINSKLWREEDVLGQFVALVNYYEMTIAQDQDYLNVICKNRVMYLPRKWNMECVKHWNIAKKERCIIHYAFAAKPWHDITCPFGHYFWEYASKTPFYMEIKSNFATVTDEALMAENNVAATVFENCYKEIERDDNFLKRIQADKYNHSFTEEFLASMFANPILA